MQYRCLILRGAQICLATRSKTRWKTPKRNHRSARTLTLIRRRTPFTPVFSISLFLSAPRLIQYEFGMRQRKFDANWPASEIEIGRS